MKQIKRMLMLGLMITLTVPGMLVLAGCGVGYNNGNGNGGGDQPSIQSKLKGEWAITGITMPNGEPYGFDFGLPISPSMIFHENGNLDLLTSLATISSFFGNGGQHHYWTLNEDGIVETTGWRGQDVNFTIPVILFNLTFSNDNNTLAISRAVNQSAFAITLNRILDTLFNAPTNLQKDGSTLSWDSDDVDQAGIMFWLRAEVGDETFYRHIDIFMMFGTPMIREANLSVNQAWRDGPTLQHDTIFSGTIPGTGDVLFSVRLGSGAHALSPWSEPFLFIVI